MKGVHKETTLATLEGKLNALTGTVDCLASTVGTLAGNVSTLTVTVETLARMTQEGFGRMEERLEVMVTKDELHTTMTQLEAKLGSKLAVHSKYWDEEQDKMVLVVKDHDKRINKLEDRVIVGKHAVKR